MKRLQVQRLIATVIFSGWGANALAQLPPVMVQLPFQLQQLKQDDPEYVKVAAEQIDKYVIAELKRKQLRPSGMTTDEQFLRRTYLNIAGRIPSYDETVAFLEDEAEGKRLKLVADLIESDGYVMSMFHFWADILRAKDDFGNGINGTAYQNWIRKSIEDSKPYDQMVRELVTARGGMWSPGNGAVGYYVRDRGMPLDNMANTTRIFLGTQIACAQCHDHPNDKWSQMEFYQMAAFTHNLSNLSSQRKYPNLDQLFDTRKNEQAKRWRDVDRWVRYEFLDTYITGDGAGRIKLPGDYKYKDGKPNEWVGARTMMGKSIRNLKEDKDMKDSRGRMGEWMTSDENPTFTSVISNRLWKRVMGVGLVEPLDNFKKGTVASNPQLLAYLDKLMLHVKYDLKLFQKILYSSKAYQLATNPEEVDTRRPYYYQGYPLQRLSAEQIWDSMLTLTIDKPDSLKSGRFTDAVTWRGKPVLGNKTMAQMQKEVAAVEPENYVQYIKDLTKELDKGYGGDMMMGGRRGGNGALMRASELPSPTSPSHFLRKFGQSDREVIENASKEGDVTQVLTLMNGHVEKHITGNGNSLIMSNLRKFSTPEEKIKMIFLSVLTREPSESELAFMKEEAERGDIGYQNMVAALINTSEFMHIQ